MKDFKCVPLSNFLMSLEMNCSVSNGFGELRRQPAIRKMRDSNTLPSINEISAAFLYDSAASFLDVAEIPKSGSKLERIGSYDVVVLGNGIALNRVQLRYLMEQGLVALAADEAGQALIYPTGKF